MGQMFWIISLSQCTNYFSTGANTPPKPLELLDNILNDTYSLVAIQCTGYPYLSFIEWLFIDLCDGFIIQEYSVTC